MYYTDNPIDNPTEDALGRDEFVNNLAKDIKQWNGEGSLVLALYGPWGSGKSSVLNLLKRRMGNDDSCSILSFDPWYFNSAEQLIQTFISTVKNEALKFANKESQAKLTAEFRKYGAALSQYVSWEPEIPLPGGLKIKLGKISGKQKESESPEILRKGLIELLGKTNRKSIILIDNLDRLDPPELLLMFKLVRLCSDFPKFVYVLAFDHKQVENLIAQQKIDTDFLAKIIQLDIDLPLIDQDDIDKFVEKNIRTMLNDFKLIVNENSWDRFAGAYRGLEQS